MKYDALSNTTQISSPELGLEGVQHPDRRVAAEVLLAGQKERLVGITVRTQQLD